MPDAMLHRCASLPMLLKPARAPDFVIHPENDPPYMRRWYLFGDGEPTRHPKLRRAPFQVMLHQILADDDDRALHDHPWDNLTIVLEGRVRDHSAAGSRDLGPGDMLYREAAWAHRLQVSCFDQPHAWTLFIAGTNLREWGFHCPGRGWVHWSDFVAADDTGKIGAGCAA
jgi:hypothetical protein